MDKTIIIKKEDLEAVAKMWFYNPEEHKGKIWEIIIPEDSEDKIDKT